MRMANGVGGWLVIAGSLILSVALSGDVLAKSSVMTAARFELWTPVSATESSIPFWAAYKFVNAEEWAETVRELNDFQLGVVEKLNRADRDNLGLQNRLIIPRRWAESELAYSPLPYSYSWARIYKKTVLVSLTHQVFGAYEEGCLINWGPISSGRMEHLTPSGFFHLNWKAKGRRSTLNSDWYLSWYFNFHNERGLSFHQYELPGYPASHACLRLLERDARWLYEWGESWELGVDGVDIVRQGTAVVIFGQFEWEAPPPWLSLEPEVQNVFPPWRPGVDETVTSGSTDRRFTGGGSNRAGSNRASACGRSDR